MYTVNTVTVIMTLFTHFVLETTKFFPKKEAVILITPFKNRFCLNHDSFCQKPDNLFEQASLVECNSLILCSFLYDSLWARIQNQGSISHRPFKQVLPSVTTNWRPGFCNDLTKTGFSPSSHWSKTKKPVWTAQFYGMCLPYFGPPPPPPPPGNSLYL